MISNLHVCIHVWQFQKSKKQYNMIKKRPQHCRRLEQEDGLFIASSLHLILLWFWMMVLEPWSSVPWGIQHHWSMHWTHKFLEKSRRTSSSSCIAQWRIRFGMIKILSTVSAKISSYYKAQNPVEIFFRNQNN